MQHEQLGTERPPQQGGIADVDPLRRRQQWLQDRHGNDLGEQLKSRPRRGTA